jgi:predicted secreted protein
MNPWRKYKPRDDPQGDKAQAEDERMIREGSQALLIAIAKAHATREGPNALRAFYEMRGEE